MIKFLHVVYGYDQILHFVLYIPLAKYECHIYYGSRLDRIEKAQKIDTKTTEGYYRLIDEAQKLN
jgi:hypothetical protein